METENDFIGKENRYIQVHSHIFNIDKGTIAHIGIWTVGILIVCWGLFVR